MDIFPAAEVKDGKIKVSGRYQAQWAEAMEKWDKKGYVQVILKAPESPATEAQNRMFHGLLGLYWKSGIHSFDTYEDMRNTVKKRFGVAKYMSIDSEQYLYLVSWADYTKKDRMRCIDGLIADMEQTGILSSRFAEEYLEIVNGVKDAA